MRLSADVNEHESVRDFACEGLAYLFTHKRRLSLSHGAAMHLFVELARASQPRLRFAAAFALAESRDPSAIPVLHELLADVPHIAEEARRAIERLSAPGV